MRSWSAMQCALESFVSACPASAAPPRAISHGFFGEHREANQALSFLVRAALFN